MTTRSLVDFAQLFWTNIFKLVAKNGCIVFNSSKEQTESAVVAYFLDALGCKVDAFDDVGHVNRVIIA